MIEKSNDFVYILDATKIRSAAKLHIQTFDWD